ncbi:MAG TPA: galactosidase, partial [Pantoea agglomerans]|nr:galactosidase [Pantoea agglomerans]
MTPKTLILALALAWATPLLAADQPVIGSAGPWPADFIKGADISSLAELEKQGAKFYNADNQQQDAIAILKASGINTIRLR